MKANFRFEFFLLLLLSPALLFCRHKQFDPIKRPELPPYTPWFTGSLLPPSAVNAKPGHPIFSPYLGLSLTYGRYDNDWHFTGTSNTWAINPFIEYFFGLNDHIGVDIYTSFISNFKEGKCSTHLQDTIVLLGLQIATDTPQTWIPDIRLAFQETFPTGKYQKLNPEKLGIDSTGQGSFQSGFNLIMQKLFPLENHFLLLKWTVSYLFPAPVHVKGFNTYGGGPGTSGRVFPGQTLSLYFSGEYSLNQRWALAFDSFFTYQGKSSFSGKRGVLRNGIVNSVGLPPSIQLSVAPQIEYNLSATSGWLFGVWGTVLGRNSPAFVTATATYYITF